MIKNLTKILLVSALSATPLLANAANAPIKLLPNETHAIQTNTNDKIMELVRQNINLSQADLLEAKVQPIYNADNKIDSILVYLLSSKNYSFTITKIQLNQHFEKISVTPNYHLTAQDRAQQPGAGTYGEANCPDPQIEFVTATPVPNIPTAAVAVNNVAAEAKAYSYKSIALLGAKATVQAYVQYLTCPKLKAFFNVGHGNDEGIMLADGMLTKDIIKQKLKNKLGEKTVVLFNSCEVFNDPLKSAVIVDADAQKYIGGITTLYIGPSELASQCLWNSAFSRQDMTPAMKYCNEHFDKEDQFGIEGRGADVLNLPKAG